MRHTTRKAGGAAALPGRAASAAGALALAFTGIVTAGTVAAYADTVTDTEIVIDLAGTDYDAAAVHAPHGQNGWRNLSRTIIDSGLQDGALRLSNAVTSGNISQIFTPALTEPAGEPTTGADYDQFTAEFSVRSATGEFQPGLRIDVSPDNGSGARTGGTFVLHHNPASDKLEIGAIWSELDHGLEIPDWHSGVLASVDPTVEHTVKLVHTFRVGSQDVVDVYVDDVFVRTVGTYEEYHDSLDVKQTINSLLIRSSTSVPSADGKGWEVQEQVPETMGEGFLIDDISYGVTNTEPVGTSIDIDLGGPGYNPVSTNAPHGQHGWKFANTANLDAGLLDGALRVSNAVTTSAFGNLLYAPRLSAAAGAPEGSAEFDQFTAEFSVAAVAGEFQPGLALEIAPDDGDGSRTGGSFIFHHNADTGKLDIGALWTELGQGTGANDWHSTVLASVDPSVKHDIKLVHTFLAGAQDSVDVYVDGEFVRTVGTFEEYHLVTVSERRTIDTLVFRPARSVPSDTGRGYTAHAAVPAAEGKGFLIDGISYEVATAVPAPVGTSIDIDLAGPGYNSTSTGAPGKQNGWFRGFAGLDNGIVDGKLRFSNATVSGIQNQLTAPQLGVSAGHPEDDAEFGVFDASFRVAAVGDEFQPGLRLEVSPDDGAGSRTGGSFTLHHNPSRGKLEIGAVWTELGEGVGSDDWFSEVLATVDPTVAHTVRLRHIFLDGQDVVHVWVDGTYVGTTGTYEEYHLATTDSRRNVNTLLFKASQSVPSGTGKGWANQPAVPELAGKGFLVDQISYSVSEAELPDAPASVSAALDGTDSITATWSASDEGSSFLTGYVVRLEADSGAVRTVPVGPEVTSRTFSNLAPGTYTVSVVATTAVGQSDAAAAAPVTVDALDVPAAPAAPKVAASGKNGVRVTWSAPADGGTALTGYVVRLSSATGSFRTVTLPAATRSHTFTGLRSGTYTASVVAKNAVGDSAASAASAAITVRSAVTIHRPFFSKNRQTFGSKDRATVSAIVIGAEGAKVDFYNGSTKLGTATVRNAVATLKLSRNLKVRKYNAIRAKFAGDAERLPATSAKAARFQVVRTAPVNTIRITGKSFKKNSRPKVTIRVGRFDNGKWATGKLRIRVDGKTIRTVNLKSKHKGKVTVRLPRSTKAVKVRAGFNKSSTVAKSWSKTTRIKVR